MKILVTGKNGQLGRSIHKIVNANIEADCNFNSNEFIFVGRNELDFSNENNICQYFSDNKFDIIVNCAAYTQVDKAEEEQDLANQVNHLSVKQLAAIASSQQTKLIHISTDYVFDGESGQSYIESDATTPINIYGKTKSSGEKALQEVMPTNVTIIRTSWVYSEYGNNFVKTMLRLGKERHELNVVDDQIGSPTYAADLAEVVLKIIDNQDYRVKEKSTEVYHYSNKGKVSWCDFAKEIFKIAKIDCEVKSITTEQYPTPAERPKCSLLNNEKIEKVFSIKQKDWKKSLQACLSCL